jgi:hypothetical protein
MSPRPRVPASPAPLLVYLYQPDLIFRDLLHPKPLIKTKTSKLSNLPNGATSSSYHSGFGHEC